LGEFPVWAGRMRQSGTRPCESRKQEVDTVGRISMPSSILTGSLGMLAAVCTTVSFLPQVIKIRRQGGDDLSYGMLFVYLAGILFWLSYGVAIRANAMILANLVTAVLVALSIWFKATYKGKALR